MTRERDNVRKKPEDKTFSDMKRTWQMHLSVLVVTFINQPLVI